MRDRNRKPRRWKGDAGWRKCHAWASALLLSAASLTGMAAVASAESTPLLPILSAEIAGNISPKTLPAHTMAPVSLRIHGVIAMSDGSHPSALREATMDLGRDVSINPEGLAVCRVSALRGRDVATARRICRKSILGSGSARFGIDASTQPPSSGQVPVSGEGQAMVSSQLTLFNGGVSNGTTTVLVHGSISNSSPMSLIMVVKVEKRGNGSRAVAKIPSIAEGHGSLLDFKLTLGRYFWREGEKQSYLNAKCTDRHLTASFPALVFRNDAKQARVPSMTVLAGSVSVPCTPQAR